MDYSLINGGSVTIGDSVQYFVVAQDAANNLGSNPLGATASANPPVQNLSSKPLAGVNSFNILGSISGTKTIGIGGDYPSLSGAGGLFAAINASVVTGDLTVNIISDLTETGSVALNEFALNGTTTYSLTIQPDSATMRTISGTAATSLITLNGADRVNIDGRFGGSGRYLTFRNSSSNSGTILFQNDASNNTVRNCVVEGASVNGVFGVIGFSYGTTTGNDNNLITDCQVRDLTTTSGVPAILIGSANTLGGSNSGNTVSNNELLNFNSVGIYITSTGNDSWTITGNNLYAVDTRAFEITGINMQGGGTNVITDNFIHDLLTTGTQSIGIYFSGRSTTTIARNRITAFNVNAATTNVRGISTQSSNGSIVNVVNNQISLIPAAPVSTSLYGLFDNSSSGSVVNSFHNSIVIGGIESGTRDSWASRRVAAATYTVRNNLFLNFRTGGTGNHFAAGNESTGGTYTTSHNVYAGTGATPANFMDFNTTSTPVPVSFASWQSFNGDAGSQAGIAGSGLFTTAMFVSAATGDLHLVPGGNALVNNAGTPIAGMTTDYDGDLRSLTAPFIGFDEILFNTAPTAVVLSPSSVILSENANTASSIELSTISITDDGSGANTLSLSGTDAVSFEIVAGKLRLKAGVALDFETKSSYTVRVNVDDTTVGSTPDAFADFTLNISDVNEAPTALSLLPTSAIFAENISTASAIELSTITFADDALGTNTLSLSGPDAASFEIVSGKLYLKAGAALDYETKTSLIVNVNVDDTAVGASPDASATFTLNLTNITELTGIDVQKGQSQRSFVRNVDILFDNDVGLTELLSGNRVKLTRMDLNGLNRTAMTLPTNAVSGRQIQLDFGAQGIGGNRNSNVGDGYFEIAIDMDGDGSFELIKNFFRLYGDVTGDGIVDSRDKAQVMSMSGTTNVEGDLNGDGVVNLTDTTAVSRAVGRKLKAGLTWDD